ncbi:paraquat-inducible protein A [Massilia sp. W12]|uniref:paraquat-inducible protein A n=1 Tax=Massilia sp. W12 TaxID=3126507 RepID=UPI0030D4881F
MNPHAETDLLACPECDLLQQRIKLPPGATARCARCNAFLYRHLPYALEATLACAICSLIFFLLANFFPLIGLEVQKVQNAATIASTVQFLLQQHLFAAAALVFVCMMLAPALEIAALLYLLLPLRLGKRVPGFAFMFRLAQWIRPWNMVEVFLLGVLVSAIRISAFADIMPGIAAFSMVALMLSIMLSAYFFNPEDLWQCVAAHEEHAWAK